MAAPLDVRTDGDPTENCRAVINVKTHDSDGCASVHQELRVVVRRLLVRVILVVHAELPARFEKHAATNVVIQLPIVRARRSHEFVSRHSLRVWLTRSLENSI